MTRRFAGFLIGALFVSIGLMQPAAAQKVTRAGAQALVDNSRAAINQFRTGDRGELVDYLLERAFGVMVFPSILKAGFFLGGEGGSGVLVGRSASGAWSNPAFYSGGSASIGLQIGVQTSRVMLILMNTTALNKALTSDLKLGADVSVAMIDMGVQKEVSTTTALRDLYYIAETDAGMFVGASIEGAAVGPREDLNEIYYGRKVTPEQIVIDRAVSSPGAADLINALGH